MGWIDLDKRESRRVFAVVDQGAVGRDEVPLEEPYAWASTFLEALEAFEGEKKKHSQSMMIVQVGVTTVYDGSHITHGDAYGNGPDEYGYVTRRSWASCDAEGRKSIPAGAFGEVEVIYAGVSDGEGQYPRIVAGPYLTSDEARFALEGVNGGYGVAVMIDRAGEMYMASLLDGEEDEELVYNLVPNGDRLRIMAAIRAYRASSERVEAKPEPAVPEPQGIRHQEASYRAGRNSDNDTAFANYVRLAIDGAKLNICIDGEAYILTATPEDEYRNAKATAKLTAENHARLAAVVKGGIIAAADALEGASKTTDRLLGRLNTDS